MNKWRIVYPPTFYQGNHNHICSIILVNTNISMNSYTSLDIPSSDITAIHFRGKFGHCSIFNIYNNCTNNNTIDALCAYLNNHPQVAPSSPTDHMLWFRDFNHHHPLWEANHNSHLYNSSEMIDPLLDLVTAHNMTTILLPGIPTYEMTTSNWTHPDNIWHNNIPTDPITSCNVEFAPQMLTTSP